MKSITTVIEEHYPSGVYYLHSDLHPEDLGTQVDSFDFCFSYLDGRNVSNAYEFADAIVPAMNFPDMGASWEAFLDRLKDLPQWCPDRHGYVLLYDWHKQFYESDAEHFGYFMDVIKEACAFYDSQSDTPLYVFFRASSYLPAAVEE